MLLKQIIKLESFKVYLSKNKQYIIITYLNNNFNFIRFVFQIKTGKLLFICKDSLINHNNILLNISYRLYLIE